MAKASFTKGFAAQKLAEGRAPMVARLNTGDTIIELETSFPIGRAWDLYRFLNQLSHESVTPQQAFDETFGNH